MKSSPPPPLSVRDLRGLMRGSKGGFAPDHVAQSLRDRMPNIVEGEGKELAGSLHKLVDAARRKLHDDGIEPWLKERGSPPRLPKREREQASNIACLLAYYGQALLFANRHAEAETAVTEGIGWCRTAGDILMELRLWHAFSTVYQFTHRLAEEEHALGRSLDLARELGNVTIILERIEDVISALIAHDKQESASSLLEEALELAESQTSEEARQYIPLLLMQKGRMAALRQNEREAIGTLLEALRLSNPELRSRTHIAILTQLGMAYAGLGDYQRNIEYQHQMVRLAESTNDRIACAWGFFRIGESYHALGDVESAEKAFNLSLEYSPEASRQPRLHIFGKRAQICLAEERVEEGIEYCRQIIDVLPERESPFLIIFMLMTLSQLEIKRQNLAETEVSLRRALKLGEETETADRSKNVKVILSQVLVQEGRKEEAEELLKEVCNAAIKTITDEKAVTEAYRILGELTEERGDIRAALDYLRKEKEHALRMAEMRAEESLQKARVLAEVELYEREAQLERERRRRMEHELAEAIVSLDNRKQVIERVEKQLQKTLSFLASEKAREVVGTLKNVLMEIDSEDEEKEHALQYLHSIDKEFSLRLRERWPGLTRKQERLCGLIRAGLTSQEILKLLGLSYEGLRAQRKRLRKALGLESEKTLETVIGEV